MSEWKIDPASLQPVLTETSTAYQTLTGIITEQGIGEIFTGLAWGGQVTACVSAALSEVLNEQQTVSLASIGNHIAAGITGVGNAARSLNAGNEDMAATFQTQMFTAADTGDFSYFEQHGYQGEGS